MSRVWNFGAGPAMLPEPVLERAAAEMLDWHGEGLGVMEMSHRSAGYDEIADAAEADLRTLLRIPANYHVLFMQGGATAQNAIIPLNLSQPDDTIDFVLTGAWSVKSYQEASRYARAQVAASSEDSGFCAVPATSRWALSSSAAYLHVCTNETIGGVEFEPDPLPVRADGSAPVLVADMSSHLLSRPIDVSRYGLIFAGAQKNIGPAGLTIVIVRDDLIGRAQPGCPSVFDYARVAQAQSRLNTPPTYPIYVAGLVFRWLLELGGIDAIDARNEEKAALLYRTIDHSNGFYRNPVDLAVRSRMNVPFLLANRALEPTFLSEATAAGLAHLKGHKSVGGMRASLYNAMPIEGVRALTQFMNDFARRHG